MQANIPDTRKKRVLIIGAGFAGLNIAKSLNHRHFQTVLIDRNNYHQFQPLFYQVATAGLEPSAISYPLRKVFHGKDDIYVRVAEVQAVRPSEKVVESSIGRIPYDYLIIATGVDTNYFGNAAIAAHAMPMKSTAEALALRNKIISNFEIAITLQDPQEVKRLLNVVIAGAGPTGVELAGAIAEMRNYILPKDYPEMDFSQMQIYLVEGAPRVLGAMKEGLSEKAQKYLEKMGVIIKLNTVVKHYDGKTVDLGNESIAADTLIWSAGVTGQRLEGFPEGSYTPQNRLAVNEFNQVKGLNDAYAIGDISYFEDQRYARGLPQLAQPAIQQGKHLAKNLERLSKNETLKPFVYKDLGTMATVGRNRAVVDLNKFQFGGFFAWLIWMFIHLMGIVGFKNRVLVFVNWFWNYITYDQSLRLIIRPKEKAEDKTE